MPEIELSPLRATAVIRGGAGAAEDEVDLVYESRLVRRRRMTTRAGREVLVDLPETTALEDGDALQLGNGGRIAVRAATEELLEIRGDLPRMAWHIGNRHTPCQIEPDRLLICQDHVLEDMLVRLGAGVRPVVEAFRPEGGAYGHGRTFGHSH